MVVREGIRERAHPKGQRRGEEETLKRNLSASGKFYICRVREALLDLGGHLFIEQTFWGVKYL